MADKQESKRENLKKRLVESARNLIEQQGLANLRARDIAKQAGCALGGLYTVFNDIDALILAVNSHTLHEMEKVLLRESQTAEDMDSHVFRRLSLAYLHFAQQNHNLWSALFEHQLPDNAPAPEWHQNEQSSLIRFIAAPLATAMPDVPQKDITARARTLFAAIHGVVSLSLENRFIGLPEDKLEQEVGNLADMLAASHALPPHHHPQDRT